jgi:hypothetical protein
MSYSGFLDDSQVRFEPSLQALRFSEYTTWPATCKLSHKFAAFSDEERPVMRGTVYDTRSHDTKANLVVVAICSAGFYSCRNRLQTLEVNLPSAKGPRSEEKPNQPRSDSDASTHARRVALPPSPLSLANGPGSELNLKQK